MLKLAVIAVALDLEADGLDHGRELLHLHLCDVFQRTCGLALVPMKLLLLHLIVERLVLKGQLPLFLHPREPGA